MLYSFNKASRMAPLKADTNVAFYELPNSKSTRATSFGYGSKYDFTKGSVNNPAPNTYSLKGEVGSPDKKGFSFGLSREQMSVTGGAFVGDKKSPGPGAYDVRETNKVTHAFSFRPRTNSQDHQNTSKTVPGPGTYAAVETMSPKGKQFVAKYKSSGATTFSPARSKRFEEKHDGEKPGPGNYNPSGEINPNGSYFVSKFKTSVGKTFGLSLKRTSSTDSFKEKIPGPGSYKLPSDFGHYESKIAAKEVKQEVKQASPTKQTNA